MITEINISVLNLAENMVGGEKLHIGTYFDIEVIETKELKKSKGVVEYTLRSNRLTEENLIKGLEDLLKEAKEITNERP